MALTDKQEMFCREYLIDLNATQAAIRAGYSAKTANRTASENLSKPDIKLRIAELKAQRNDLVGINAEYVLNRLIEIDQMDVLDILLQNGELKPIKDWPKVWGLVLSWWWSVMTTHRITPQKLTWAVAAIYWYQRSKHVTELDETFRAAACGRERSGN